ncbi:MAG: general secretion pathway protein GspK [Candidatus Omnitrophica bacterium]|nr:general secretion pathway protein GspK [Candidatus Omnitrophota bacterium]
MVRRRVRSQRSVFPPTVGRGIALLIVVSILTVVAILGVSFVFSMNLETQESRQFSEKTKARYLAEAGVGHARALLAQDRLGSRTDDLTEVWTTQFAGADVDIDGDLTRDGRWWPLTDVRELVNGHYGVIIRDEAGKININTALANPQAMGVEAPNLTTLLERIGVRDARAAAQAIEQYRYGPDGRPGLARVDDDRDGQVDEADEYQSLALRGDDRRFESLEELAAVGHLDRAQRKRLATVATVYSWDQNVSLTGRPRVNVNTATADELLNVLLEVGVDDPWQLAVNLADYADEDLSISRLARTGQRYDIPDQGDLGDWRWHPGSPGYYTTDHQNGQPLSWGFTAPSGEYHVLVRGVRGQPVGDVELHGQSRARMESGESFGTVTLTGAVMIQITCRESAEVGCAFRGIGLVPTNKSGSMAIGSVRGIEAVRFNELMVSPTLELGAGQAVFDGQLSGWTCSGGCVNSGTGRARWSWTAAALRPGSYHLRVYGTGAGQTVGEVDAGGQTAMLTHGQRYPETVTVGSDLKVSLTIGKTSKDGTYYFQKAVLSLEPDAEYVELINLSDRQIDLGGWVIEGDATQGRQARLPVGSRIRPHGLVVCAVDVDDTQPGLAGNGIDARTAWEIPEEADVVQLEFPGGGLSPDADWLGVTVASGHATLQLKTQEWLVDEVEYPLPPPATAAFQSLEKADPSAVEDADGDGIDDGWYPSMKLQTPGAPNDNLGLRELKGLQQIVHDPATEVTVLNRPLRSVGELAGLPSGRPWQVVSTMELARAVDRLTVEGVRLETEGHLSQGAVGWTETVDGCAATQQGATGSFRWNDIPDGQYRLSLYGWSGEQLSARWQAADQSFSDWIPSQSTDAQGRIIVGQVTVGMGQSPANTLALEVRCDSPNEVCHFNHAILDPQLVLVGAVNVNTAPKDVLMSLPGMTDAVVDRILAARPFGDQDHKSRGIGDLLAGSVLGEDEEDRLAMFRSLAHWLTVRSDVFQILSLGESSDRQGKASAIQRVQAVVQR